MKHHRQLWFRFALLASSFVVLLWIVFSVLAFFLFRTLLIASLDESLELSVSQALSVISADTAGNLNDSIPDFTSLGDVLDDDVLAQDAIDRKALNGEFLVQIFDAKNNLILSSGDMSISPAPPAVQSRTRYYFASPKDTPDAVQFRALSAPIILNDKPMGTLRVFLGTDSIRNALDRLEATALWLLPLFLILTFAGSGLIARRSLAPIDRMAATAIRISESDLHQRVPITGREDELDLLAGAFNGLLGRLERAFDKEKRFTADAAHELRTPLHTIQAIAGITEQQPRDADSYRKALKDISAEVTRLSGLTDDLLFLSRESDSPVSDEFDLDLLVEDVTESLKPLAGEKGLFLRTELSGTVSIHGDRDALVRALINLIGNGIQYSDNGGITVKLNRDSDSNAVITVADTGQGIEAEHLPHIFERFYRGNKSRSDGGTGLGLALAREIVYRHGGRLEVESTAGMGATFRMILPVR